MERDNWIKPLGIIFAVAAVFLIICIIIAAQRNKDNNEEVTPTEIVSMTPVPTVTVSGVPILTPVPTKGLGDIVVPTGEVAMPSITPGGQNVSESQEFWDLDQYYQPCDITWGIDTIFSEEELHEIYWRIGLQYELMLGLYDHRVSCTVPSGGDYIHFEEECAFYTDVYGYLYINACVTITNPQSLEVQNVYRTFKVGYKGDILSIFEVKEY